MSAHLATPGPRQVRHSDDDATAALSRWVAETSFDRLPPDVVEHVKWCFIDSVACGLGGRRSREADALIALGQIVGGAGRHVVFGERRRFGMLQAAQANRVLINILDYDDTIIGTGHMSSVAVAAALAIGEHVRSSGRDVIAALALAYEMPLRLREAVSPSLAAFRSTFERVDSGVHFCATVAAGRLLGLTATQFQDAFGLTGHVKPWHVTTPPMGEHGMPEWFKVTQGDVIVPGLQAALLAHQGFPGDRGIFDSHRNYAALVGSDRYDVAPLMRGYEPRFKMMDIGFKNQPCCRHISAFADGLERVMARAKLNPADVARITVKTHMWTAENLDHPHPQHMIAAQFSMPHALAMTLIGEPPGAGWYDADMLFGAKVDEFRGRVRLMRDERAQHIYDVEKRYAGEIEVLMQDGAIHACFVDAPRGATDNPFSEEDHRNKLSNLAAEAGFDDSRISRLWDALRRLEKIDDINEIVALLTASD